MKAAKKRRRGSPRPNLQAINEARRQAAAARRGMLTATFTEVFDGVFTRCGWFAEPTWRVWRVVGKAIFGEPMSPEDLEVFRRFTGRSAAPTKQVREFWAVVGRRAGKGWFCAAVAVYLAVYRPPALKAGTLGRVMILAVDRDQASEVFGYVRELLTMAGHEDLIEGETKETVTLRTGIEIQVRPADRRRVRGRTLVAVIADEVASWWNDDLNANPDVEIFRALRPGMLGVDGALLMAISSPFARKGSLYEAYSKSYGQADARVLVWQAPTWAMRPSTDPDFLTFLEEARQADPISFKAEYGAQFRTDVESFVSIEVLDAVTIPGRVMLPHVAGVRHLMFCDLAGGMGEDSATAAIVRVEDGLGVLVRVEEWRPPFSSVDVARGIAALAKDYGIHELTSDNFGGATYKGIFQEVAPWLSVQVSEATTSDLYAALIPLLTGRKVQLLDHERLRNQLLALERHVSTAGRERITHPARGHDDLATSAAGALVLAAKNARRVDPLAWSYTKDYTQPMPAGAIVDRKGTCYIGDGTFITATGERYRDPRY